MSNKNTLNTLNDHLFAQLERLTKQGGSADDLHNAIEQSKAVSQLAKDVVSVGRLTLDAEKHRDDYNLSANKTKLLN